MIILYCEQTIEYSLNSLNFELPFSYLEPIFLSGVASSKVINAPTPFDICIHSIQTRSYCLC